MSLVFILATQYYSMKSHELDYQIYGDDMQVVEVELDPNETVIAEAGVMNWMDEGINFEARLGDGSEPEQGFMGKMFFCWSKGVYRRIIVYDPFY